MKIGIFDSGLGGLLIFKELSKNLPQYDYVYLGDVKRLPYGNRSDETIFEFTKQAVLYLFEKQNCKLVILACNTASAKALRRIQKEVLPNKYSDRRVLGVVIPTAEEVISAASQRVGILATKATANSGVYKREINKLKPKIKIFEKAAPSLVTLIENDEIKFAEPILKNYLRPLVSKRIDTLVLGCTHYPIIKKIARKILGNNIKIISQEEIISGKLKDYLERHPEIENKISLKGNKKWLATEITDNYKKIAKKWFGGGALLELINIEE